MVNGLECRLQNSQVISSQACKFRFVFLGPIPDLCFCKCFAAFPGNAANNLQNINPEWRPEQKFKNLQAWLEMTWLFCNLHSKPLTKYFPPLEAATAADLAQAFEPGLRRLRQQPT